MTVSQSFTCILQAIYLDLRGGMNFETASNGEFPLYGPLIMLIVDSVLYFLLAMYFDNVIPGKHWVLPWSRYKKVLFDFLVPGFFSTTLKE